MVEIVEKNLSFNEIYLSQLFIEVRSIHQWSFTCVLIKHFLIPCKEIRTKKFLHFHSDVHGYRNNVVEKNHECKEVCKSSKKLPKKQDENIDFFSCTVKRKMTTYICKLFFSNSFQTVSNSFPSSQFSTGCIPSSFITSQLIWHEEKNLFVLNLYFSLQTIQV